MPIFSPAGETRIVYGVGVGLNSKMFYNPKSTRMFQCVFEAQGGSNAKLPTTIGTVVKTADTLEARDFFYDIACPVGEVNIPPTTFKLSVSAATCVADSDPCRSSISSAWCSTACVTCPACVVVGFLARVC